MLSKIMLSKNELLAAPAQPVVQPRNVFLDKLFYDVNSLLPAEKEDISEFSPHEGAIVTVSPKKANKKIRHYNDTTEMLKQERESISGVAVAGVGSSILGTASLARNVADTYETDIAGVVSGYGASDLLTEAMGGWFFYGYTDRFRHSLEIVVEKAASVLPETLVDITPDSIKVRRDSRQSSIPRQLDSGTLLDILMANPNKLEILVGHSKGALLIDFVLEEFVRRMNDRPHRYYDELHVVTVSSVIGMPKNFKKTSQIIGELDWFGFMNSRADLFRDTNPDRRPKIVANAWHHLNQDIPHGLCLADALRRYVPLQ